MYKVIAKYRSFITNSDILNTELEQEKINLALEDHKSFKEFADACRYYEKQFYDDCDSEIFKIEDNMIYVYRSERFKHLIFKIKIWKIYYIMGHLTQ